MDPSITVFDYKHERATEIVQEIRVKDLDVGNGVDTVAFMSEDSVTEFHGSHEWAQGRKFLKLQFRCRGRRGKLTEVILENTFLGSFRSIFPNRGHYVYLVNKAQPQAGARGSTSAGGSGLTRSTPHPSETRVRLGLRLRGAGPPSEDSVLPIRREAEGEQVVQVREQVAQAVERVVEREIAPMVQQVVQDLSPWSAVEPWIAPIVQRAVERITPRLASEQWLMIGECACGTELATLLQARRDFPGRWRDGWCHVCGGVRTQAVDAPWVDAAGDGIASPPRHERINHSLRAHRFPSAVERAVERNIPQLI